MLPLGWTGAGPQFAWGAGLNNPQAWEQLLRMWGVDADPAKIREMMERGQSSWGNMSQVRHFTRLVSHCVQSNHQQDDTRTGHILDCKRSSYLCPCFIASVYQLHFAMSAVLLPYHMGTFTASVISVLYMALSFCDPCACAMPGGGRGYQRHYSTN